MKSDLDRLMAARGLQALIVAGDETYSAHRDYLTNGAKVTGGLVVKKQGSAPVMVVNPMEVEEAAESGLKVYSYYDLDYAAMVKEFQGDYDRARMGLWINILKMLDVPAGKIGVYGTGDLNVFIDIAMMLNQQFDDYQFIGERGTTVFDEAFLTKDADEIARITSVAERTSSVIRQTMAFISGHRADGETVVKDDGSPLTIGEVKRFIRRALLDVELEDTEMIFAQGRDAGFPHSRGKAEMPLQRGKSIVFDLFPRELSGGYFHDMTRTWCIDYAPPEVQQAYDETMEAFNIALATFEEPGQPSATLQNAVCDYYESKGHPTLRTHPNAMEGYVHTLGHGVGLQIHESPKMRHSGQNDILQVGNVVTIEPGLYYPDRGFGVRIEDMLYINEEGAFVTLTDVPKDLILPLKG